AVAMGKRAHGVVDMHRMPHAEGDTGTGLLVGGVGVPHGDHDASIARCSYARYGAEHLRRDSEDASVAGGGLQKALQQIGGRRLDPLRGMYSTAHFAKEWALVVDAEDFRLRLKGLELSGDVTRNSFDAATGVVGAGGYCSGEKRSCTMARQRFCYGGHALLGPFHYVVAT